VAESAKLCNYFHFREPEKLQEKSLLQRANLDKAIDFMDSINEDIPKGTGFTIVSCAYYNYVNSAEISVFRMFLQIPVCIEVIRSTVQCLAIR